MDNYIQIIVILIVDGTLHALIWIASTLIAGNTQIQVDVI
jgi:hypothetical protein